jgi:aspartate-semialdehyde dehydrogenase
MDKNVAIIGASGAIGNAFVEHYSDDQSVNKFLHFQEKNKVMKIRKFKVLS